MIVIMGQKRDHTANEKSTIVSEIGKGKTNIEISKILERDHRTIKKFVQFPISVRSRKDKGKSRVTPNRTLSRVRKEVVWNPCLTSRELFRRVGREAVSKTIRCRFLKQVAKNV